MRLSSRTGCAFAPTLVRRRPRAPEASVPLRPQEYLWHRPDAFDFLDQAMLPAFTLPPCAVPFMLITSALAGRSAVSTPALRLGPNQEAAAGRPWSGSPAGALRGPCRMLAGMASRGAPR
ncbi:hypothetical protein [Streptomyces sp. CB01881]|uniref:hypothetical protein n=1 Tax=Streptomyces sp. CB01881 TaxID=2078691 RepID=UPI000CDC43A2|nr:hypothetical protein [Streptomyces sp. CB01881]AUY53808.1 hypothetical protein C2142_38890 [Streptomyces sp. CB01881]TYC68815.1 hypothetical protein EH183_38880 [Streptomyces sp. CB01881]